VAVFAQVRREMDVVQRNIVDVPIARGKWADEGDVHCVSLQYRTRLFPNANVAERKVPPLIQGVSEIEANGQQEAEQRRENQENRPFDAALEERQGVHGSARHHPEKSSDRLDFQNAKAASGEQVGYAVVGEPEEIVGWLVDLPLIRYDKKQLSMG